MLQCPMVRDGGKVITVKYHAPHRCLTRKGRPNQADKEYYRKRRYDENRKFAEYFGKEVLQLFQSKGFLQVTKGKLKNPILPKTVSVVTESGDTVITQLVNPSNVSISQSAFDVMETVVTSLEKGNVVEGFALIPEDKVKTNGTVDKVLIEKFARGRPCYGYSLVSLKKS